MAAIEDDFLRRLDRTPLDANSVADRYESFRARDAVMARLHERLRAGVDNGLTGTGLSDLVAELSDGEFSRFLNAYDWDERRDLVRFPPGYPTPWRLGRLHQDRQALGAAGGRSPAAVYRDAPEAAVSGLSESAHAVVRAVVDSDMSVQPVKILDDPRGYGIGGSRSVEGVPPSLAEADERDGRPANRAAAARFRREGREVIRAVALAAHYSGARVLAMPAHGPALAEARTHRHAHHIAENPDATIEKLVRGEWKKPPPGALIIVDDADQLDTDQVLQLSTFAGDTNTKLLLVTADHAGVGPVGPDHAGRGFGDWDRSARETTDTLTHQLPWGQYLGDPADHRLCAIATDTAGELARYMAALSEIPDDIAHQQAAALLERHNQIVAAHTELAAPVRPLQASRGAQLDREQGLSL